MLVILFRSIEWSVAEEETGHPIVSDYRLNTDNFVDIIVLPAFKW